MRYGQLSGAGGVALTETAAPRAGAGEVVVRLAACGVCGTDLEKLRGNYRSAGILGHEPVGRVAEVGAGAVPLAVGDRVFVHHHVPCYRCEVCARGDYTFCPTYSKTNIRPGGFSEEFLVPAENVEREAVLRLDPKVSWEVGALLEPAGCALTAIRRVGLPKDSSVFVLGFGPVGILYARLAKALGARWVGGSEVAPLRRKVAEAGGVDATVDPREPGAVPALVERATGGRGVDLAVVAVGHPSVARDATGLVRRGGTVNLFGLPESGSRLDADLQDLYLRGVRIVPSYATVEPDIREVHRLVVEGTLRLDDVVTHRVPLERLEEAFRLAGRPEESVKVVVTGPAIA
ncbi:MAG TPA: alcohol dehydrogenase catalytic domain-containing protein [Thermoplasmata archaeon]|nr:alcohol dehydrogenase catalytic domain-containing protein [Thermoplasmata archaeon]